MPTETFFLLLLLLLLLRLLLPAVYKNYGWLHFRSGNIFCNVVEFWCDRTPFSLHQTAASALSPNAMIHSVCDVAESVIHSVCDVIKAGLCQDHCVQLKEADERMQTQIDAAVFCLEMHLTELCYSHARSLQQVVWTGTVYTRLDWVNDLAPDQQIALQ